MSGELRDQMYNELNLRETEDLLEIWHTNDHEEWSDTAFEVIKEILTERLGEIPLDDEMQKTENVENNQTDLNDGLEEWEARALDDENQPDFYDTVEVLALKNNIDLTLKAVIIVNILTGFTLFSWYKSLVAAYFPNRDDIGFAINIIAGLIDYFGIGLQIVITYFPLKALMNILKILMEMEFRSRKAG